jgi:uncharacterized membrane protein YgdD (TMEM256/DUF423 family)
MDDGGGSEARVLQRGLVWSGLAGLAACGFVAALCIGVVLNGRFPILLPYAPVILVLVVILGAFSLAEIPMMVYALRRLAIERESNYRPVHLLNVLYVFFAGVYAAPVMLLTGSLLWGSVLFSLSLVRFVSSLVLVRPPHTPEEETEPPAP